VADLGQSETGLMLGLRYNGAINDFAKNSNSYRKRAPAPVTGVSTLAQYLIPNHCRGFPAERNAERPS
jgi:hypothetical protein